MRCRLQVVLLAVLALASQPRAQVAPADAVRGGEVPGPLPVFPADNWWNQDISAAPVDPGSAQFITFIGPGRTLHPDFGGYDLDDPAYIYGIPYVVVGGDQPKQAVEFYYANQSDGVTHPGNVSFPFYPIPEQAKTESYWIEGGPPGNADPGGDRHMLILDRDNRHLYELFDLRWTGTRWEGGSGAFFDLNRNDRRPDTWTSADAAGLAIFPGLVRYDEVYERPDEIRHAFRVTVAQTNGYVWPASHRAGSTQGALPMGARLRLKSSVNIANRPPEMQKIFRAMQRYGLIVADNGSNMYITGTFDPRWNNGVLNPAFASLKASDFEVIQLGWRGTSGPCSSPGAPASLTASVSGSRVTLSWVPSSGSVESYVLEVGNQPGASNLGTFTLPAGQTTLAGDLPAGHYFFRLRAQNACGSAVSAEAEAIVPSGCSLPAAPSQLSSSVNGSIVVLNWSAVPGVSGYVLEVGSASGASDLLQTVIGGTAITGAAPPGLYHARVRGQNACGTGPASPERVVSVGGCAAPAPAGPLTSSMAGNVVTLQWPPMPGATAYRIEVGSAPGASNLLVTNVNTTIVSAPAPPGTYHVRVRGVGSCGTGGSTNEVIVHVP